MSRRYLLSIIGLVLICQLGCREQSEIRQYDIPKSRSDLGDMGKEPLKMEAPKTPSPVPARMIVAILEREDSTWFFKLTGPVDAVNEKQEQWQQLFSSITFEEGSSEPQWQSPDGWNSGPPSPWRFATLLTSDKEFGTVEFAVSNLGPDQNILDNVNRWRDQLGQPPVKEQDLKLGAIETKSGALKLFDETGVMVLKASPPIPRQPEKDYTIEPIDGWKQGRSDMMTKVRLSKGETGSSAQITVSSLPAGANNWTDNARRWADQVDMDDSEESVTKLTTKATVDGFEGDKIRLIPDDEKAEMAAVGIMVKRNELAWFFKIIGNRETVIELESEFDQFVDTFRFK